MEILENLVTDLDGTLLNSNHIVSRKTINALHDLFEREGKLIIATGRPYFEVEPILYSIGKPCPVICLNGAIVYDHNRHVIFSQPIDTDIVLRILHLMEDENLNYDVTTKEGTIKVGTINRLIEIFQTSRHSIDLKLLKEVASEGYVQFMDEDDLLNLIQEEIIDVYKLVVYSDNQELLGDLSWKIREKEGVEVSSSAEVNLEINAQGVSKGRALKFLADKYGYNLESFISAGDSLNDLSMLKVCGFPVAMANADYEVKEIAQLITSSNDENGIAEVILREILH